MKFLPEFEAASTEKLPAKLGAILLTASLSLGFILPALADKIVHSETGHAENPPNTLLIGLFTIINYIAGIAILAAIVFCGIWFFQRKDDGDEVDEGEELGAVDAESVTTTDVPAKPAGEANGDKIEELESKPEETKSEEEKNDGTRPNDEAKIADDSTATDEAKVADDSTATDEAKVADDAQVDDSTKVKHDSKPSDKKNKGKKGRSRNSEDDKPKDS